MPVNARRPADVRPGGIGVDMAGTTELDIVSATGVVVRLRLAGPGARAFAFVLDILIRGFIAAAWVLALSYLVNDGFGSHGGSSAMVWIALLPAAGFYFFYHPVFEWLWQGRTPGKHLAGVRLVDAQGRPPQLPAILVRNVFRIIDSLPFAYAVGLITCVVTRHGVRLGDMAGGTLLVYAGETPGAAQFEDHAVRASAAPRLALAQELVERWATLDPHARRGLAVKLLGESVAHDASTDEAALLGALQELVHGRA